MATERDPAHTSNAPIGFTPHEASAWSVGYEEGRRAALAAPPVEQQNYADSTPSLHVGGSAFESWYQNYLPNSIGHKQISRDAYAAGMGDPLVTAAAQPAPQAGAALVEAVAKAIMFEDCGSTESWAENTNLAEAAIRVCDARNPPRCSHCHSATSAPVHPTEQPSQDAALVAMAEAWELCAADLQEYEEDAAADAWRKAARDLRQHAARTAQAQGGA